MEPSYNALILTTPADFERLQDNFTRMVQNLAPRRILFIGSQKVNELIQQSKVRESVSFLDEEELIPFADVHRIMMDALQVEELPRGVTGWYYQQFLKMQYAFICKDEYYLVWDGDTVPCRPFSMFAQDGRPYFDLKQEYCEEYFYTLQTLFPGMHKSISKSFISEHMLMNCDIMKSMIGDIMKNDSLVGDTFYERIIRAIRPGQLTNTAFSEFETYGTYVSFRYTYAYRLRDWHSFRLAGEFFHPERMTDEDYEWLGKDFDALSFEKGHTVREDHEEIFTSPRYRSRFSARQILELAQQEFKEGYIEVWDDAQNAASSQAGSAGKGSERPVSDAEDEATAIILEASKCEETGDRDGMFEAVRRGLQLDCDNYELYYMLGYYYLQDNVDQAYLCFQNASFYCRDEEDRATIRSDMLKLTESGQVDVRGTAIVIVSYNSCYLMQKNIESIRSTLPEGTYKIVVVDNASDDGVERWLREQNDILLIENDRNVGFSPACNQGVEALRGTEYADYDIFLLNNDTRLAMNSLFWLKMGLYESEEIGAVGACSNYAGNNQQLDVEFALPADYLSYGAGINMPERYPYEGKVRLSGFAMLVKSKVWGLTGGMDEDFAPGYFEDDDLSMKILKAGYRLMLCKNSFIYHAGSQSFAGRSDVEDILISHHQLFIEKYGFDIFQYADADRELIAAIPYTAEDEFCILQIGCGIGAELSYLQAAFPGARVYGIEPDETLYRISGGRDSVFPDLRALAGEITQPTFQVLLIPEEAFVGLSEEDAAVLQKICVPDCVILSQAKGDKKSEDKDDKDEDDKGEVDKEKDDQIDVSRIKIVVWDLDQTFWKGILSEGGVEPVEENIALVRMLADCGIVNSVSSKNDEAEALKVLWQWGVDEYFVFPDINWQDKGVQIQKKLEDMHLRAENALFLDDDIRNLEEAKYYCPEIMTGTPEMIPGLFRHFETAEKKDIAHKRLDSYRLLEQKRTAAKGFADREQFLYYSEIALEIREDCMREIDRISELVSRTNQLNYTKVRDDKETLVELLADESIRKGCIRVRDRFGDYGVVGFYCYEPDNANLRHFLFSCRVMGMGIEQCVYSYLGCPDMDIVQPVSGRIEHGAETPWIRICEQETGDRAELQGQQAAEDKTESCEQSSGSVSTKDNRIKVLLKGPCDMDSIAPYLSGGDVTSEFNFVNDQGFITTGQNHSMNLWESENLSAEQLREIVREVPFITMDDFKTSLFCEEYHVICYSLLPDCHTGLYRNRKTGAYISFGSRNFDLTAPENRRGYIDGSIVNHAFPFTAEIISKFSEEWEFVGSTSGEDILRNLDYIYTHVLGEPDIVLLLGSEIEYEGINEEFANHAEVHRAVNALVRAYAADKDRIKIIEMTDFIRSQTDYEDSINHFSRNVYYELAGAVCGCINEKVNELVNKKREEYRRYEEILGPVTAYLRKCKGDITEEAIELGIGLCEQCDKLEDAAQKESICGILLDEMPYGYPYSAIWWYSVICNIFKASGIFCSFVKYVRENKDAFSVNTLYFLFYQLLSINFRFKETDSNVGKTELWKLFLEVVEGFEKEVKVSLEPIPMEKRNPDLVIVITEQLISVEHGPTKTALDRCKAIMTELNKGVFLINTAEMLSSVDAIPFINAAVGNYMPSKLKEEFQEWKGVRVPYFQCEQDMPNVAMLDILLQKIRDLAPCRIVSIGGTGILSNLANKIIPVITVGLCPSDLECTGTAFQTLGRKITDTDRDMLRTLEFRDDHVIESVFTSSLKPQTQRIAKADLGIAEDSFLLIVVGARLDDEVTDEFLSMLDQTLTDKMFLGFLGRFDTFDKKISGYRRLADRSKFFGFCDDILSYMEVCDLYVNPTRKGGGTSCVEAMYQGVPVVTVGYGDVSVNAGEAFWVRDYEEMKDKILQYCEDRAFYESMSALARERTKILLDTEKEFIRILDEADRRERATNE